MSKKKNKDYKYDGGLTSENVDEELLLNPAFMNEAPTQEQIDRSPALQALQKIKYDEENPEACALSHKEDGNYHFQRKEYRKAITAYTEGLKQKHDDEPLKAVLLTNRAAANFHLGNNRTALNDAIAALKYKPGHMKAIIRGAIACFDMEKYEECVTWCERGLKVDAKEQKLINYKKKAIHQKKQKERDERKQNMKQFNDLQRRKKMMDAMKERAVTFYSKDREEELDSNEHEATLEHLLFKRSPRSGAITLDENNEFHWPLYLLYPEYNQSDFVEDCHEDIRLSDQLNVVFSETPEWDVEKSYTPPNVEVFFEDTKRRQLIRVDPNVSLKTIIADKRYRINGECPTLMILSKNSDFYTKTFENQKFEDF
ncbi:tetratricopeptide repeat protein 4-like [Clytia hemisphaerica]|uniref:Cns1/TTC4 wheel domain-containing protein n=1 Tax=Clytia hemisphaerica TaxID=252671 RepID=A0A7M5UYV0_9CNID